MDGKHGKLQWVASFVEYLMWFKHSFIKMDGKQKSWNIPIYING
jgi:hypothetical protein